NIGRKGATNTHPMTQIHRMSIGMDLFIILSHQTFKNRMLPVAKLLFQFLSDFFLLSDQVAFLGWILPYIEKFLCSSIPHTPMNNQLILIVQNGSWTSKILFLNIRTVKVFEITGSNIAH